MKRTYQPNKRRRAKRHGFRSRMSTRGRPGDPANSAPEGPRAPLGLIGRVGDRATFDALRRDGRRARRGPMTVIYLPGGNDVRVAYAIGRKVGPAVVRNRVRRRLREAVRELDRTTGGLAPRRLPRDRAARRGHVHLRELRDDLGRGRAPRRSGEAGAMTPAARVLHGGVRALPEGRPPGGPRPAATSPPARTTRWTPSSTTAPCGAAPSPSAGCSGATPGVATGGIPSLKESTTDARRPLRARRQHAQLLLRRCPQLRDRHRAADAAW